MTPGWRTIDIRPFLSRSAQVQAWCHQDFAVHRCIDIPALWQITLLPLGMCLAIDWCAFDRFEDAADAAREMAAQRNDWHVIEQADLTKPLEAQLRAIARRHHAPDRWEVGAAGFADRDRSGRVVAQRPNGYGAALDA